MNDMSTPTSLTLAAAAMALCGCVTPLTESEAPPPRRQAAPQELPTGLPAPVQRALSVSATPKPPEYAAPSTVKPSPPAPVSDDKPGLTLNLENISLPAFIQTVYGTLLKRTLSLDAAVAARKDLVTLRVPREQTPREVERTAALLLKTYGVTVSDVGGLLRFIPDNAQQGYAPEIRRGRALPEVPLPMRPIHHLIELDAVRAADVANYLRTLFGQRITLTEDTGRNAVLLTGQPGDVAAAIEAMQVLDQPMLRARQSLRINPAFWPAGELASKLVEVLGVEGYSAGINSSASIVFVPVPTINALLVFAVDRRALDHVVKWADELDKPNAVNRTAGGGFFTYQVQNTDAAALAKTLQDVIAGGLPTPQAQQPGVVTQEMQARIAAQQAQINASRRNTRITVNPATNTLILQSNPEEYAQLISVLRDLDRPSRQALIEVTVAEVKLSDQTQLGFEWFTRDYTSAAGRAGSGVTVNLPGSRPDGAFTVTRFNTLAEITARLSALASESRARVLSNPRVLTRSGETASIQVGQEVPVITSQQSSTAAVGSATGGVLQTVQYRNTGVILKVRPIVYSNDRVEIDINQEVSSAKTTQTGVTASPTIDTSSIATKLTLRDGESVAIAGMIRSTHSLGNSGVPGLKSLPVVGQAFRSDSNTEDRSELVMFITAYVISDDSDAQRMTEELRRRLSPWTKAPDRPIEGNTERTLKTIVGPVLAP
jgi:general secretion pathway protein D